MKGLDLAEEYFHAHGAAMLKDKFSAFVDRIAVGYVGPGSECFGYDDEISRDHDWGPGFCIWITAKDYKKIGKKIQRAYEDLPQRFMGFGPRIVSTGEEFRTGVCEIGNFYRIYTGLDGQPNSNREWLNIPEPSLAMCTNGRVFADPLGEFTRRRDRLLEFFPEDVRLKKIASRCFTIAQAGQYNFARSLKRKAVFALQYAVAQFCVDAITIFFLLNRRYTPFYKWLHHAVKELPRQGKTIHAKISELLSQKNYDKKQVIIEEICTLIIRELKSDGLSDAGGDFLLDHAYQVHERIKDQELGGQFSLIN